MEPICTEKYNGYTIEVHPDESPESPREWDNLTTLVFMTRNLQHASDGKERYDSLGKLLCDLLWEMREDVWHGIYPSKVRYEHEEWDGKKYIVVDKFMEWDDFEYDLRNDDEYAVGKAMKMLGSYIWIKPIRVYEHGGYALSFNSWRGRLPQEHYEFDTYTGGVAYIKYDKVRKEYGVKRLTKSVMQRVEKCAESKLKTFNYWLNGDVYGFVIKDGDDNEVEDGSVWGYYGSVWGYFGIDDCISGAKEVIDGIK